MNQTSTYPAHTSSAQEPARVAFISSSWHREIVDKARESLLSEFERSSLLRCQVDQFEVPGAFEIPLHAKKLAQTGRYDAIVACGLVTNGGIYRHEFVTSAVIDGLMRVQSMRPVIPS